MSCPNTPFWEDAEACELSQITKLGTYKLVPLPPGCSAIGSKWVYKIKCDNAGNITQYCAHIITKDTPNAQALIFSRFMHLLLKLSLSESYSLLQHHWIGRFTLLTLILHAWIATYLTVKISTLSSLLVTSSREGKTMSGFLSGHKTIGSPLVQKNWKVFSPKWTSKSPTQTYVYSSTIKI